MKTLLVIDVILFRFLLLHIYVKGGAKTWKIIKFGMDFDQYQY